MLRYLSVRQVMGPVAPVAPVASELVMSNHQNVGGKNLVVPGDFTNSEQLSHTAKCYGKRTTFSTTAATAPAFSAS